MMSVNNKDYEELAKSILAKSLNIPENSIDAGHTITDLKDIDSVEFAILIATIEKQIHRSIPIEELLALDSVQKLTSLLERYC